VINSFELIDLHLCGGKYTWSSNQPIPTLERLDRFLVDKTWENVFPSVMTYKLPRDVSDHNAIILNHNVPQPLKNLSFRFELSWVKHPEFLPLVQELWNKACHAETAFDRIQAKLKRFKQYFKGWGFNKQGENRKIKSQMREKLLQLEQIEEEFILSLEQTQKKIHLQSAIFKSLEEEELYWFKRSSEKWLHEGDNNTEYFHRIANGRRRKNLISLNDGGSVIEGTSNLLLHAINYYKDLFEPAQFPSDPALWRVRERL
jgi:hypothetical protein